MISDISEHLFQLGVTENTLNQDEKNFLGKNGYLILGKLLSDEELESIRRRIFDLMSSEGGNAGSELLESKHILHPKEAGADRLADLVNKGPEFDIFYTHPKVLAAIQQVLGPSFKLSSLNYRAALPGTGEQKLHVDWHEAVAPANHKVCNSIWLLDDFTIDNGATRLVPGTHQKMILPQDEMENPFNAHPEEILIIAPAGSVVVVNSHTWHGGTRNNSPALRRAIHSYFCRRDQPQQVDQKKYFKPATKQRLNLAAQTILGVDI